jgi:hypothetical protein
MDFSSNSLGSPGAGGKTMDANQKAQMINSVKQQLAMAKLQEMLETINNKCFKMCILKPGSSLSGSEQVYFMNYVICCCCCCLKFSFLLRNVYLYVWTVIWTLLML